MNEKPIEAPDSQTAVDTLGQVHRVDVVDLTQPTPGIEAPAQAVALSAINAAYVDWDLIERMRCGEEIDSEEAGMIGAMIDSQAREIEALRAALSAPASMSAENRADS